MVNTNTINSRESDIKFRTKDSLEYSYGNDLRKMEPKILENDSHNQGPIDERNDTTDLENSTWGMDKNKTKQWQSIHNVRISSDFDHRNKVLLSKTRLREDINADDFNVS
jgi:hypothetical protein